MTDDLRLRVAKRMNAIWQDPDKVPGNEHMTVDDWWDVADQSEEQPVWLTMADAILPLLAAIKESNAAVYNQRLDLDQRLARVAAVTTQAREKFLGEEAE